MLKSWIFRLQCFRCQTGKPDKRRTPQVESQTSPARLKSIRMRDQGEGCLFLFGHYVSYFPS